MRKKSTSILFKARILDFCATAPNVYLRQEWKTEKCTTCCKGIYGFVKFFVSLHMGLIMYVFIRTEWRSKSSKTTA